MDVEPRIHALERGNLVRIRYFLALSQRGSFQAAAAACAVSQPAITSAIRRLERAVGAPLFTRSRPVRLTPLGERLRPLFASVQRTLERIAKLTAGPPAEPG